MTNYGYTVSVLLKKKISKSDIKTFAKLKFYKSHIDSECLTGDCKNGFSSLKESFKYRDGNNNKHIDCIYLIGNFQNGKLNGEGVIYVFNHTKTKGIDKQLKSGDYNLKAKPKYTEFISSDFKNNVASKGIYSYRNEKKGSGAAGCYHNKTILVKSSRWNKNTKPLFSTHFRDIALEKKYLKPTLEIFYHGNFTSINFRDETENGKSKEYSKIEINYFFNESYFHNKRDSYIRYSIYPEVDYKEHFVDYKVIERHKIKEENTYTAIIENGKCSNCDILKISNFAVLQKEKNRKKIEKEKLKKLNKANSFLGRFIKAGTNNYYVNEIDEDGCLKLVSFPTKKYVLNFKKGNSRFQARNMIAYLAEDVKQCNLSYYEVNNVKICSSCAGVGKITLEDLSKYRKIVWEKGRDVIKHLKPSDVACKVCAGSGVVKH